MARIPESTISHIKSSIDLVSLCQSRGIELKRIGKNYTGRCPFHDDETASFVVTPSENLWNCFGCGIGGNVIQLIQRLDSLTFPEAIAKLSPLTHQAAKKKNDSFSSGSACTDLSVSRHELLKEVSDFYHLAFKETPDAREYLSSRGIVDASLGSRYQIGWCRGTLRRSMPKADPKLTDFQSLGILTPFGREFFSGCVVFPLLNTSGHVVNLYGRKVSNGRINHLYLPGPKVGIFNVQAMKSGSTILLVESVLDALALIQAGYPGAMPIFGSAGISGDVLSAIKTCTPGEVVLCFDGDDAGKRATQHAVGQLAELGITPRVIPLPSGEDPCSFLMDEQSRDTFKRWFYLRGETVETLRPKRIDHTGGTLTVVFSDRTYEIRGVNRDATKCRITVKAFMPENPNRFHLDTLDIYSSRSRAGFARGIADCFGVQDARAGAEIMALIGPVETMKDDETDPGDSDDTPKMSDAERTAALLFLKSPDLFDSLLKDFESVGYTGETTNKLMGYLAAISRKLDDPLSICIQSRSAAGKSALQDAILDFVPPEDVVRYTCLTGQALFYKESDSLKHRILAIEEDAGARNANYSIRTLQSSNHLSIASAGRDPRTGKLRTEEHLVEGPTSFFMTTTASEIESETGSRFVFLTLDESSEATARVHEAQRLLNTLDGLVTRKKIEHVIDRHRNAQRLLQTGLKVVIPFAKYLRFRTDSIRSRRDHKKYLTLIQAIAFVRQFQRKIYTVDVDGESVDYVEATVADVRLANDLASDILGVSLDELSPPSRRLLGLIREFVLDQSEAQGQSFHSFPFTRRAIREYTGWSDTQVKRHIHQLVDLEYIASIVGSKGREYVYELQYVDPVDSGGKFLSCLIDADELARLIESDDQPGRQK
ncbi:MAG TPA: CHC2 zinc finger domain-containing protein [bacterium]|nr:CHC2 zinc finger domain-containing protein [bacterium]